MLMGHTDMAGHWHTKRVITAC